MAKILIAAAAKTPNLATITEKSEFSFDINSINKQIDETASISIHSLGI